MARVVNTPIGYVEVQKSWIAGEYSHMVEKLLGEAIAETTQKHPELVYFLHHTTAVLDGAGVMHMTLYVGFAPKVAAAEPLDPRNLNGAPVGGQVGDPARENFIGVKEQKF